MSIAEWYALTILFCIALTPVLIIHYGEGFMSALDDVNAKVASYKDSVAKLVDAVNAMFALLKQLSDEKGDPAMKDAVDAASKGFDDAKAAVDAEHDAVVAEAAKYVVSGGTV